MTLIVKKSVPRWLSGRWTKTVPLSGVDSPKLGSLLDLPDEHLMLAYQGGNDQAFAILLSRHQKGVYNYFLRYLGSQELAEEALQEVFLKLIRVRGDYEPSAKFTTWLYTLVRHHSIDQFRREKLRQHVSLDQGLSSDEPLSAHLERAASTPAESQQVLSANEIKTHLFEILGRINPEQKEVFLLREFQGLSFDEIAQVTGTSANTVKSRMRYAIRDIQAEFEKIGIVSEC